MDFKGNTRKRNSDNKPLCKYGLFCYQRNPEHRRKFKHPSEKETKENGKNEVNSLNDAPLHKNTKESARVRNEEDVPQVTHDENSDSDEASMSEAADDDFAYSSEETVDEILKSMPKDFFDFWKLCASINKSKPEDAFREYGYHLVGAFDLLAKKLPKDMKIDIPCHWRYYFDPPEFQTVIKKDGSALYHIGYFRDDPSKKPLILASNSAAKDSKLTLMGDNIFCAMNAELSKIISSLNSSNSKEKAENLQKQLKTLARKEKYELTVKTNTTERRRKKVVAKTFHGLGIVVPVKDDVGYRPVADSDAVLKNILNRIVSAENQEKQLKEQEALDGILSCVQFANDECDFGMGLELGIDLFCHGDAYFHDAILRVLPLAYDLLNRSKYAAIISVHLKNRKKGQQLSTLNV